MEVKVAQKAGFCFGVKRAVDMARQTLRNRDGPIYTLGPLIHNKLVTGELAREGIIAVDSLNEITGLGTVIIRSHGVSPELIQEAKRKNLEIVDATCPFVRSVQQKAQELVEQNMPLVIVGDPAHPEVQGILGWSKYRGRVIVNADQVKRLDKYIKVGVVAQTTQRQENLDAVVQTLQEAGSETLVFNTICSATTERQRETRELAEQVDVMLVIGGHNSANTAKLAQICSNAGVPVCRIETIEEVNFSRLKGCGVVGITAGASTPGWIIEEVCRRMKDIEEMNNAEETAAEQNSEAVVQDQETGNTDPQDVAAGEASMQQEMEDAVDVKTPRSGDIVKGVVVQVNQDEVLVDVGAKSEGVIPIRELSCYNVDSPQDVVQKGDEIEVYVLKSEDNEGRLILSKKKADAEKAWTGLEEIMEQEQPVKGVVREVVKGGLLVDLGVRAFLPASLVEMGYVEDLSKYLNQEIEARVIELNRARRKVIVSRKAVLEEEYTRKREELLANLEEGQVVNGVVRRLTNFGAFVDIGGVDGLLHISEMAWFRINHPSEVVQVGDELEVMVLRVDRENEKISLGLKQVVANPWENVDKNYPEGAIVDAKVVRLAPFGAFVQLEPGVEGLVHISHLADRHVETPDEVVREGEEIKVRVLSVDKEEKRIRLSIREVDRENKPRSKPKEQAPKRQQQQQEVQTPVSDGGSVTIGEMVGDIFEDRNK